MANNNDVLEAYRDDIIGACKYILKQCALTGLKKERDSYATQQAKLMGDYDVSADEWIGMSGFYSYMDVCDGLSKGDLGAAMWVVGNYVVGSSRAALMQYSYMLNDGESSLYGFMRQATGDSSFYKSQIAASVSRNADMMDKYGKSVLGACDYLLSQRALEKSGMIDRADSYETQKSVLANKYKVDAYDWLCMAKYDDKLRMPDRSSGDFCEPDNLSECLADGYLKAAMYVVGTYMTDDAHARDMKDKFMDRDNRDDYNAAFNQRDNIGTPSLYSFMRAATGYDFITRDMYVREAQANATLNSYYDDVINACRYLATQGALQLDFAYPRDRLDGTSTMKSTLKNKYHVDPDDWYKAVGDATYFVDKNNKRLRSKDCMFVDVRKGLENGDLRAGMLVAADFVTGKRRPSYDSFEITRTDDESSLYAFLRKATGDGSITQFAIEKQGEDELYDDGPDDDDDGPGYP